MKLESVLATKGPRVVTIAGEAPVRAAVALLVEHNIGALVVVDAAGAPQGILSERDIIRESARNDRIYDQRAAEVMTRAVVYGSLGDDVEAVLHAMTTHHFRHLPILDDGALVGIVSIGDVVKAQLNDYVGSIETLQTQLMNS